MKLEVQESSAIYPFCPHTHRIMDFKWSEGGTSISVFLTSGEASRVSLSSSLVFSNANPSCPVDSHSPLVPPHGPSPSIGRLGVLSFITTNG